MIITLQQLAAKAVKSNAEVTISDHTLDFKNVIRSDYGFEITGNGSRNLVIKNLKGTLNSPVTLNLKFLLKYAGTANIIKFVNCHFLNISLEGTEIYGSGNDQSQPIMIEGDCKAFNVRGGYINQGRNKNPGNTKGGACIQILSAESTTLNASNHNFLYANFEGMVVENACDEAYYLFKFEGSKTPKPSGSEYASIKNCRVVNLGRDAFQGRGIGVFDIINNYAANGALEQEPNHISGVSWNGENPRGTISGNTFENFPQMLYAGTEGVNTKLHISNNVFKRGGIPSNQACYLKGPGEYTFRDNVIDATGAKRSVIACDGAVVNWDMSNTLTGPKPFEYFNGGKAFEESIVTEIPATVSIVKNSLTETRTVNYDGISTLFYTNPKQ